MGTLAKSLHRCAILIVITGTCGLGVQAQTYFSRVVDSFSLDHASHRSVLRASDGSWFVRVNGLNGDDAGSSIMKLDEDGDLLFVKRIKASATGAPIACMALAPDDHVIGLLHDTLEVISPALTHIRSRVFKMNPSGGIVWSRRVTYDVNEEVPFMNGPVAIAVETDGSFFIAGLVQEAPAVLRLEPNGELDWSRRLVDAMNGITPPLGVVADGTGGCVFLANAAFPDPDRVVVGHFSSSGSLLWCKQFDGAPPEVSWTPLHLERRFNDHLLITASSYTTGLETSGVILDLSPSGTITWARKYLRAGDSHLSVYQAQEISDDHLLFDWQRNGFGLTELDEVGNILNSSFIPYRYQGGGLHVVGWNDWTTHGNELSMPLWYLLDDDEPPFATAGGLLNMDLSAIGFCTADTITIVSTPIPASSIEVLTGTTAASQVAISEAAGIIITNETSLTYTDLCPIYLNVPQIIEHDGAFVVPTVTIPGSPVRVRVNGAARIDVFGMTGQLIQSSSIGTSAYEMLLETSSLGTGVRLVVAIDGQGALLRSARILLVEP